MTEFVNGKNISKRLARLIDEIDYSTNMAEFYRRNVVPIWNLDKFTIFDENYLLLLIVLLFKYFVSILRISNQQEKR
jgi:hypothetical protein